MGVRGQGATERTSTPMERPEQVGEVSEESVWGVVAARREGRRRVAAGPGLCAEGGWGSDGWQRGRRLKVPGLW